MSNNKTVTISKEDFMKMSAKVTEELMDKPGASAGVLLLSVLFSAKITEKLFPDEEEKKPEETPVVDAETLLVNRVNGNEKPVD